MCSLLSSVLYGTGLLRGMVNLTWGAALKGKYDLIASTMAIDTGAILFIPPLIPPGIQVFRGESAGMRRNSGIPADSGGIRGGIRLQFTIKDII